MISRSRPSSAISVATTSTAETLAGNTSPFSPLAFLSLLNDGAPAKEMKVYSEKDLQKAFAAITAGLNKVEDWQARIAALLLLQGLTIGDGPSFEASFLAQLKGCHELIMTQIADLRSSVSKEACRTVALLAVKMGNSFAILGEFWLNALMKQVVVKIAVMSSAADRCIRVMVCSSTTGYIKILNQIIEYCSSKSPMTRKCAYEYISLACTMWKMEIIEKSLAPLKAIVKVGIADADPNVRKAARQYFWVLRHRIQLQPLMDSLLNDLDPASQRHIVSELQNPSADLGILIELISKQLPPLENYLSDPSLFSLNSARGTLDSISGDTARASSRAGSASQSASRTLSNTATANSQQQSCKSATMEPLLADLENTNGVVFRMPSSNGVSGSSRRASMGISGPTRIAQKPNLDVDSVVAITGPSAMKMREKDAIVEESFAKTNDNYETMTSKRVNTTSENAVASRPQSAMTQMISFGQPVRVPELPAEAAPSNQALPKKNIHQGAQRVIAKQPMAKKSEEESKGISGIKKKIVNTSGGDPSEMGLELMKAAVDDVHWENRLAACEAIRNRLQKASIMEEAISSPLIDNFVDLAVAFLNDAHQKVVSEAMDIITFCVEHHSTCMTEKLGILLPALFHRLADRRSQMRDQANAILNTLRVVVEPNLLVSALSPKIVDIPEKMKTAVIQYLVVLVPHCSSYFSNPQNTWAFLGRLGNVLGNAGSKPSATLVVAAKRLLDLVYNAVPSIVCAQIATLSLQQQSTLKKLLESSVPDIDNLVIIAGRSDWKKNAQNNKLLDNDGIGSVSNNSTNIKITNETTSTMAGASDSNDDSTRERDITWLLNAFRIEANRGDKIEANTELRKLIKTENDDYWRSNCAQIVCVLLEPFNAAANMMDKSTGFKSPTSFHEKKKLTGLSPAISELETNCTIHGESETKDSATTRFEAMHLSCKALLLLVKYKAAHVINFMDLLVSRLCQAAAYAPVAITLHCEQILADLAPHSPHRLLKIATPYSTASTSPHVQLLAIHTICVAIKHMPSPQILEDLETTISAILPSLSNSIVDLRKAVIFVLVEIYMNIGDALYPYIVDLQPPQRKLLTIYIQKNLGK